MTRATEAFHNRIALVFDFDDTLAPGTFGVLLDSLDLDHEQFLEERVKPLTDDGWEETLARVYCLIQESQSRDGDGITRDRLEQIGRDLTLFDDVDKMFDRVRQAAHNIIDDIEVEFYLLTAGFVEIPRATSIAQEFKEMWGCQYHFDDNDEIIFVRQMVTHPEKVRYILQLSKGLGIEGPNSPANVYRDVPDQDLYIPLDQIIYVGDGNSDLPAFRLMNEGQGIAIGVYKGDTAEDWKHQEEITAQQQIQNLAPADYSPDGELMQSLILATEGICKQVALHQLSQGE